jgi:hypothetical protein
MVNSSWPTPSDAEAQAAANVLAGRLMNPLAGPRPAGPERLVPVNFTIWIEPKAG